MLIALRAEIVIKILDKIVKNIQNEHIDTSLKNPYSPIYSQIRNLWNIKNMFLSTYENRIDKKGRVSVPASFRSHLSNIGYNGVICYPSFNNQSIEACSQDRIEKLSASIDSLNPFEERRDFFATSILSESMNLQFDSEGRISLSSKLLKHAKIKNSMLFVGQGQTFQIWEPTAFEKFNVNARKKANVNRASLKWEKHFNNNEGNKNDN